MADTPAIQSQFPSLDRQREANRFGMLVFLATEVLLFSGVFAAALELRFEQPDAYLVASKEMHMWLGGINTLLLLTSSALVAAMVQSVRSGQARLAGWLLGGAIVLGIAFLAIKFTEYALEYDNGVVPGLSDVNLHGGPQELFMNLYFAATGLHAVHVTVGLVLLASLIWPFGTARRDPGATIAGNIALYWHLVDIVWIFLYPTLYLAR